ncbi:hypothetical protein [Burkholderia ubonensis]|uniref:hypothetical protein n=1 Tax=Burkholderia ubonensis TaxID=101571 RepID=UPI002AAFB862|nr:hypothetical protein [Burkholderia ubonensis]
MLKGVASIKLGWVALLLNLFISIFSGNSVAAILEYGSVVNGYSSCSWRDNGNGTSTLRLVADLKYGPLGSAPDWRSRGVLVYSYDRNGNMNTSSRVASKIWMNGVQASGWYTGTGYVMYHGYQAINEWTIPPYDNRNPFVADIVLLIENSGISSWPAVSVRAGSYTSANDVAEVTGGAYISRSSTGSDCMVIDPVQPPPIPIVIGVTAPDWNLGELQEGENVKKFSNVSEQLCFTYTGTAVSGKSFVINASNVNGVASNAYRLRNLKDTSQLVPYGVILDSGTSVISLPNASNAALQLNSSGKTCFVPTFWTSVGSNVKEGDYSDVLTFTVVTKS